MQADLIASRARAVIHRRYIRYLARGITGGEVFIVPVSGNRLPGSAAGSAPERAARSFTDPAVCLVTVGYLGTMSGVRGCLPLIALQHGGGFTGSAEIVNAPPEQQALKAAGLPPSLRHGSIMGGAFPDAVASIHVSYLGQRPFSVPVRDNYAQFHTLHSAPVAARASFTPLDAQGHPIRTIKSG
jgi:hypothetical protein